MTVAQLILELQNFPKDMEVALHYTSSDHWNTELAEDVASVQVLEVTYSDYHNTNKIPTDEERLEEYRKEGALESRLIITGSYYL